VTSVCGSISLAATRDGATLTADSVSSTSSGLPRIADFVARAAPLDFGTISELCSLFVPNGEGRDIMVRAVAEEALALTSITLFLAMVAVWAQVLGVV
jgi:hypothetical protein